MKQAARGLRSERDPRERCDSGTCQEGGGGEWRRRDGAKGVVQQWVRVGEREGG